MPTIRAGRVLYKVGEQRLKTIHIHASRDYAVMVGAGLLDRAGELAAPLVRGRRAAICAGENVMPLYGERLRQSLESAGFTVCCVCYPAGESAKTPETLLSIVESLAQHGLTRADAVFALGGGVTGDMAGLAAALYQRGIACIQLPTTLLAAVDASVGGKTAVNLPQGKNQLGVFSQPALVLCDTDTFRTLPPDVYTAGWAEVIKCGFLRQGVLQELLTEDQPDLEAVIAACVEIKRDIVAADEFDTGERQLLNFGHTVGHAIEKCADYRMYHGFAVAIGMAVMTRGCVSLGLCAPEVLTQLENYLQKYHLPQHCNYSADALFTAAMADKKRSDEHITLIQPVDVGVCRLVETDFEQLRLLIERGL